MAKVPVNTGDVKVRPEIPRKDRRPVSPENFATISGGDRVRMASKGQLPGRMPERMAIERQIVALKANIDRNLHRIASLYRRGYKEKAIQVCTIVATNRARMLELSDQWLAMKNAPVEDAKPPMTKAPRFRAVKRVKREVGVMDIAWKERNRRK